MVEYLPTDPDIQGSNPATCRYEEKMTQKKQTPPRNDVGLKHSVGATLNKSPDEKLNFWHSKIEIFVEKKLEMFSKFSKEMILMEETKQGKYVKQKLFYNIC